MKQMVNNQPLVNRPGRPLAGLKVSAGNRLVQSSEAALSQDVAAIARVALQLFLAAQFFSLSRKFFFEQFGEQLVPWATLAGVGSFALLPVIWWGYAHYAGSPFGFLQRSARPWLAVSFLTVSILTIYGWLWYGYSVNAIVHDFGPYLIFFVFIVVGSIPRFWQNFLPVAFFLTGLAVFVNLFGLQEIDDLLLRYGVTTRVARDLLAYDTKAVLAFWPLLLLTVLAWRNRARVFLIFGFAIFVAVQEILFQKRLTFAEALAYIVVLWFVLPFFAARWQMSARLARLSSLRVGFLVTLAAAGLIVFAFGSQFVLGQATGLTARYGREDTSRIGEAMGMARYLQPYEWFVGRGMGGYFEYVDPRQIAWGQYLEDAGVIGKRSTHVGALMPMLKGGLLLTLIFYWGIAQAVAARQRCMTDMLSFAAWVIVAVKLLVSLQGNFFLSSTSYELMLFSLCLGRVLTERREVNYVS